MRWFFLLLCLICWSLGIPSHHSAMDINVPYLSLTHLHHQQILTLLQNSTLPKASEDETPQEICLYQGYRGYSTPQITKLITEDMIQRSFNVQGSFQNLRNKIQQKLRERKPLNVLYIGGSVCVGHGCHLCKNSENVLAFNEASFQCSWTHRFTRDLEYIMKHLKPQLRRQREGEGKEETIISPRYCCKSATSTNMGLDILITKSYRSPNCHLSNTNILSTNSDWEPDLIFWDYSVNDLSSRVSLFETSFLLPSIHLYVTSASPS
jgi:hypothetical protein